MYQRPDENDEHRSNGRNREKESRIPLGAVRSDDGQVVVPSSRRADGSVRKPIRIREGYLPQDEVPKYKTIAQRVSDFRLSCVSLTCCRWK